MSIEAQRGLAARARRPSNGADGRVGRRSRVASAALVLILLGVSVFAVWTSQATNVAAERAVKASALSDDFADAATAVAAEESLERKYRLEPGPDVRTRYNQAAAALTSALGHVRRDGTTPGTGSSSTRRCVSTAATSRRSIGCSWR